VVLAPPRRSARVAFALEQESCVAFTVNIVFVICYLKILSKTCASRRIERFTQSVPSFPAKRTTTPPFPFFFRASRPWWVNDSLVAPAPGI